MFGECMDGWIGECVQFDIKESFLLIYQLIRYYYNGEKLIQLIIEMNFGIILPYNKYFLTLK